MAIVFGRVKEPDCSRTKCLPEAPKYEERCCIDPCNPCGEKKCPPKTCASEAIKIDKDEVERCFTLRQMGCNGRPIPAIRTCVKMEVRRKGFCTVLLRLTPYRADHDNGICFSWGEHFKALPSGYYECDVYINDECCTHILLYKPFCNVVIESSDHTLDDGCNCSSDFHCCNPPQVDEELDEVVGTCNTGCK